MKIKLSIILLAIFIPNVVRSERVISNFDIARWYLDSDLVLICTVDQLDTILINEYSSTTPKNELLEYEIIKESYFISLDSIIKKAPDLIIETNRIETPDFVVNKRLTYNNPGKVYYIDSKGDTIFHESRITKSLLDFSSNKYFRLSLNKKHIVILSRVANTYIINYQQEYTDKFLVLLNEIESKGESYFPKPIEN
jgi:phage pi2 protein 07